MAPKFAPLASVLSVLLTAAGAFAQGPPGEYTWNTTSGNWSVGANWQGGQAPPANTASDLDVIFSGTGPYTATNDFAGNFGLQLLIANYSGGTVTVDRTGGQTLVFNRWVAGNEDPGIRVNGSGNLVVRHLLDFNDNNVIVQGTGSGLLRIGDSDNPTAAAIVNSGANHTSVLTVNYSGGPVVLYGTNSQDHTDIQAGTVAVGANGAFGTGVVDVSGAGDVTLRAAAGQSPTVTNQLNLSKDLSLGGFGNGLTLDGPIDLQGGTRTLTALDSNTTIGGVIGNGGLTVAAGGNTLTLTGANTYAGATTVATGTLRLSGTGSIAASQTVQVNAGATLDVAGLTGGTNFDAGTGRFALAAAQTLTGTGTVQGGLTARSGSTVAPGDGGVGNLTVNGNVTLQGGSTFAVAVTGPTSNGRLTVNGGAVDLTGASLNLTVTGSGYSVGDRVWIVVNNGTGPTTGRFAGLANNGAVVANFGGLDWAVFYDGDFDGSGTKNDVYISPVPEPAAALGICTVGLLGLVRFRRANRATTA
jgi:autotransporter-associated beta strand protein